MRVLCFARVCVISRDTATRHAAPRSLDSKSPRNHLLACSMSSHTPDAYATNRICLRDPIPEIMEAAALLDQAVTAHLSGQTDLADELIRRAEIPAVRDWTESLWGTASPYVQFRDVPNAPPSIPREQRLETRMPNSVEKKALVERDGYHCRFCGIPVIRTEVRNRIRTDYPDALRWGATNPEQHAAFQAMWLQYDHILPHARGGNNDLSNLVVTCAPCNFARMNYTLDEVGLADPRLREHVRSEWDGLERYR